MTGLGEPRELTGTQDQVTRTLTRLSEAGLVRTFTAPEPHPQGCRVWWWMRQPEVAHAVRPLPMPATRTMPQPAWTPRQMTPAQRQAAKVGGTVLAVGGVLAGVVWLVVRAVSGVWSAVTGNPFLAWVVVALLAAGGWTWLTRERSPKTGGGRGGACQGIVCHCAGCRGH